MNWRSLVKRFVFGFAIGLFIAIVIWSYSAYYLVSISPAQGIIGSLILSIPFGVLAAVSNLDKLIDSLPDLPFL
ncbi:hypothetical protein IQ255_22165 [Pleurocapsales cyanobacterium LEGE 10410]|nr:hypothetical protein [Pleurocapsales cyanobacterium LEGE 10410]